MKSSRGDRIESTESTRCDFCSSETSQMKSETGTVLEVGPREKKGFLPLTGLSACKQIC